MKGNEAPEKIYRTTTYLDNDKGKTLWQPKPVAGAENIEYTRTDAFVEKACEWLNKEIPNTDLSPSSIIKFKVFNDECKKAFISDFKKYMEGE